INHGGRRMEKRFRHRNSMSILLLQAKRRDQAAIELRVVYTQVVHISAPGDSTAKAESVAENGLQPMQNSNLRRSKTQSVVATPGVSVYPSVRKEKAEQIGNIFVQSDNVLPRGLRRECIGRTADDGITWFQFLRCFPGDL